MTNLIGLTPGERDAAIAALAAQMPTCRMRIRDRGPTVDLIVDAVNQHRLRVNQISGE